MNSLERVTIEKAGYANGFEAVYLSTPEMVEMFSARHRARVKITSAAQPDGPWSVFFPYGPPASELARTLPEAVSPNGGFQARGEVALWRLLRRAFELAMSLPTHAVDQYAEEAAKVDAAPPQTTEAIRLAKQRIGQNIYRQALMDYWGGACAVTGIAVPELLRASHALPWAECTTDQDRLNVFNGFLLCAHLDALFDRGLITFADTGEMLLSPLLDENTRQLLNLHSSMRLRWVAPGHHRFLHFHRTASPSFPSV